MKQTHEYIATLTDLELNALALGVVRVDRDGTIEFYNRVEAESAHRTALATVGLNYFRDVAPCTAVKAFRGRFDDFVVTDLPQSAPFTFSFPFGWRRRHVSITLVRGAAGNEGFYIVSEIAPGDE